MGDWVWVPHPTRGEEMVWDETKQKLPRGVPRTATTDEQARIDAMAKAAKERLEKARQSLIKTPPPTPETPEFVPDDFEEEEEEAAPKTALTGPVAGEAVGYNPKTSAFWPGKKK